MVALAASIATGFGTTALAPLAGASSHAAGPQTTSYTGIDPGPGLRYTYAPSIVQTTPNTRYVFYCGNTQSNAVIDHVYLSVGHQQHGRWQYGTPSVVLAPTPGTFYSQHTCEPQVLSGDFHFGGHPYRWAMFFTAESAPTNSTNTIGLAFANAVGGPYVVDPTPLVTPADDFGINGYPNNCPTYPTGATYYCVGEPTATTIGAGHIVLSYMGNSGSPGNDTNPIEGQVIRELNLSNVPASGPCTTCFLTLPNGQKEAAVSDAGLGKWWFHNSSIAYDPQDHQMVVSFDNGPADTTVNPPPVTPVVTVARMPLAQYLGGKGRWQVLANFGQCLSGYTLNHNTGIVQSANGDVPASSRLTVMYTVADNNLAVNWGVWDYRMWTTQIPLDRGRSPVPSVSAASARCPGLDVVRSTGHVSVTGSARYFGSASAAKAGAPIVGMALTPDRQGYYLVARNGRVLTFGDARNQGSVHSRGTSSSTVGIALDAATGGYWVAQSDGTVHGFGAPTGDATTTAASGPIVGITGVPNGAGYYLVSANGEVYAFGDALSYGNMSVSPGQTVAAIATTPNGLGYYAVTRQGAIAAFGDAQLYGPATISSSAPVAGVAVDLNGFGYWTIGTTGHLVAAGNAGTPSLEVKTATDPIVGIVAS